MGRHKPHLCAKAGGIDVEGHARLWYLKNNSFINLIPVRLFSDVNKHLAFVKLAAPYGQNELEAAAAEAIAVPFDARAPLWKAVVVRR